jgi:hypothetical protein
MTLLDVPLAGDLERLLSEDLYPYRYPLTIGLIIALIAGLALAYRLGWHRWLWERRIYTGPALILFLAVFIPVSYYLVSPLWERNTVCEASPIPGAGAGAAGCEGVAMAATNPPTAVPSGEPSATPVEGSGATASAAPAAFAPRVVREGTFMGADDFHFGEGRALLIETAPETYVLRFEEFSVRNGPDLFVLLSPNPGGYSEDAINLGGLKGTDGAFNYDVPPGTDITRAASAVVWCDDFSVLFATATFN